MLKSTLPFLFTLLLSCSILPKIEKKHEVSSPENTPVKNAEPELSYLEKAQGYFDDGQLTAALEWAQKAQNENLIGQDLIQAHMLEGLIYELSQQPEKSIEPFRRALKFAIPHNVYEQVLSSNHLAYNLLEINLKDEAYAYFQFVEKNRDWLTQLSDQILADTLRLYFAKQSQLSDAEIDRTEKALEKLIKKELQRDPHSLLLARALFMSSAQFNEKAPIGEELTRLQKSSPLLVYAVELSAQPYSDKSKQKLIENLEGLEASLKKSLMNLKNEPLFRARTQYQSWIVSASQAEDLMGSINREWVETSEDIETTKTLINQIRSRVVQLASSPPPGTELTKDAEQRQRKIKIYDSQGNKK